MQVPTINSGLSRFLPENKVDSLSPQASQALAYYAKIIDMRSIDDNVVIVHDVNDLPILMKKYFWAREQAVETLGASIDWWNRYIEPNLHYIYINNYIRQTFQEALHTTDNRTQNAKKIYSPEEIAEVLREKAKSTVTTVLVPIPLLTMEKTEMRRVFKELLKERLADINNLNYRKYPPLNQWAEIRGMIAPKYREHFGRFQDDVDELAMRQSRQKHRVRFKEYGVKLPKGLLPIFRRPIETAFNRQYITREMGNMTIRDQGWVCNRVGESNKTLFTPGLAIGGDDFSDDYRTGLLDLWTAERFVEVFGEDFLKKWPFRFTNSDVSWMVRRTFSSDYTLPIYLARLIGQRFLGSRKP